MEPAIEKAHPDRWWTLAVPLLVSLCLGLYRLDVAEPHVDFVTVAAVFPPKWVEFLRDFLTPSGIYGGVYPPVYFVLAKAYGGLFGSELVTLRTMSVLALCALVAASWYEFPLLTGAPNPLLRFWFVMAVATSPAHIWWAQTAKYTIWLYLAYAVALLASLRFLSTPCRSTSAWLAVSFLLVFGTHYVSFFFIAASFAAIALIAVWRRDRRLLRALVATGALASIAVVPVLPAVLYSLVSQVGGYHAVFDEPVTPANLLRALLMDWNFGNSLLPRGGGLIGIGDAWASLVSGRTLDLEALRYLGPGILAAGILAVALAHAWFRGVRHPERRGKVFYLASVLVFTLLFSMTKGLANRFVYFGFGTWCTLAVLVVGWGSDFRRKMPVLLAGGILAVNSLSLVHYYSNLRLKYPGSRLIVEYLASHPTGATKVIVDDWIVNTRHSPIHPDQLPAELQVDIVDAGAALRAAKDRGVTLAFLAGTAESIDAKLRAQAQDTNVSWTHELSFDSMESRERSIHLYRFER